jgi:SpoVK/Ycf46/Vps4 family AAA+-type ATPase
MINKLKILINSDIPVLCWGAPGVGKTAAITALAKEQGAHLEVVIGSTIDPTDLGRPVVGDDGNVYLAPPAWARRLKTALDNGQPAWLFLDELTSAPPSVQAALLRVTQERQVADLDIRGVKLLAAANPPDQGVDVSEITAATANRWAHLNWVVDVETWCAGELGGWGVPDEKLAQSRALISTWIQTKPDALVSPPSASQDEIRGWPSPRSWSAAAKILGALGTTKGPEVRQMLTALIGNAATSEFLAWTADNELPNAEDLLNGKASMPSRGDRQMLAMSCAIAYAVTHKRLPDLWTLCRSLRSDLAVMSGRRGLRAAEAAKIDTEMTEDLEYLIAKVKELKQM